MEFNDTVLVGACSPKTRIDSPRGRSWMQAIFGAIMPDRATERSVQRRDPGSDATARQDIRLPAPLVREQNCYFAAGEACGAVQAL